MKHLLIASVRWYQKYLSPLTPSSCRFRPTCSQYMIEAVDKHGLKGVMMGLARIVRCHPLSKRGLDPVPDHFLLRRNRQSCHQDSPMDNKGITK
ncbi:membrane protein insertion efficiency factor YidD [Streptococcus pluranimalium]|uniref:membrane protein insertion efficiency factor YidD n=1 Tax=Streptococcus pluranimalium TaxID=82348 RepID=UPI000E0F750D|nr:membrane protein insertion efficiency factor YidD [Streptococcus pluranimalium]